MNVIKQNSFHLQAVINGVTLAAGIVMDSGALAQQLNTVSNSTTPSWAGGNGPQFHVEVRNSATGEELTPEDYPVLYYNGTALVFAQTHDTTNCTNSGALNGLISRRLVPAANGVPARWTYKFLKSPFSASGQNINTDNDTLRVEGVVTTVGLNQQSFRTPDENVLVIQTTGTAQTYIAIAEATDYDGTANGGIVHAKLVDLSSNSYDPVTADSVKWYDMDGANAVEILSSNDNYSIPASTDNKNFYMQVLNPDEINGTETFKVAITKGSIVYESVAVMVDRTDGFFVGYTFVDSEGVSAGELERGSVAQVNINVYRNSDPSTPITSLALYPWVTLASDVTDQNGNIRIIPNSNIYYTCTGPCVGVLKVGYQQLVDWGGGVTGYISLEETTPSGEYANGSPTANTPGSFVSN